MLSGFSKYVVLLSTPTLFKVKFINKDEAKDLEKRIKDLGADLSVTVEFDALTHPGNIYVRGLVPELNTQDLHRLFEQFGIITSCKIVVDEFGRSRGYGFVNFADGVSADQAIEKLNGLLVNGSKLYLNHHIAKKERLERLDFERENFTNLYVKNIPDTMTEDDLRELFAKHGEISTVFIPDIKSDSGAASTDSHKKFGFVNMKTHENALSALEALDQAEIEPGIKISVSRAQRRDERPSSSSQSRKPIPVPVSLSPTPIPVQLPPVFSQPVQSPIQQILTSPPPPPPSHVAAAVAQQMSQLPMPRPDQQQSNLYVKGLSPNIDDGALFEAFAAYGVIVSARTMTTPDGQPRGYGFVCFKTLPEAANAIVMMNNTMLDGNIISVTYAQRNNKHSKQNIHYGGYYPPTPAGGLPPPPVNGMGRQGYYYGQVINGNGYPAPMGPGSHRNTNGLGKNGQGSKKKTPPYQNVVSAGAGPQLTAQQIAALNAEIASLESEEEKRAKFIDALVAPRITEKHPLYTESQLYEKCDEITDGLLEKYGQKSSEVWQEIVNDWTNDEGDVADLLKELKI